LQVQILSALNDSNPSFLYWLALHEEFRLLGST